MGRSLVARLLVGVTACGMLFAGANDYDQGPCRGGSLWTRSPKKVAPMGIVLVGGPGGRECDAIDPRAVAATCRQGQR
ncbi:hypothetical protein GW17_00061583 [Ensete ventricosum]|nr:hypothetical protein GW17_00061583 [Ensete ventricosum]